VSDFMVDGQPAEAPLAAADKDYAATPPSYGDAFAAMFQQGSTGGMLQRWQERAAYQPGVSGTLGRAFANLAAADAGAPPVYDQDLSPIPSPMLSADEANTKYAPLGPDGKPAKITETPIPDALAQMIGKAKADEIQRAGVIARFENSRSLPVTFGTGAVAFMLDPVNAASAFIPGFGEETVAARLGGGLLGRTAGRLVEGATGGALAQAPLSALRYGLGQEEASDYGLRDAFRDVLFGAAGNAAVHVGLGTVGDVLGRSGTAAPIPREVAPVVNSDATTKYDAMRASVAQVAEGRPVNVSPIFEPKAPQRPEDIIDFLQSKGGVQNESGELGVMDLNRPQKGRFGVLVNRNGLSLDYAREAAEEAGFLPEGSTIADMLDAVQETAAGNPRFRPEDAVDWMEYQARRRAYSAPEDADVWNPNDMLSDTAESQRELYANGFTPGISGDDLHALNDAIYFPDQEELSAAPQEKTPEQAAVARAEGNLSAEDIASLSDEDRAELDSSAQQMQDAEGRASAYDEAGSCLGGAA
jgi:hypothetical protein